MVFEMLRDMIGESLGLEPEEITLKSDLREDLGLSDTELEEVMDTMSGELGFRFDPEELESVHTVAQLVRFISGLV